MEECIIPEWLHRQDALAVPGEQLVGPAGAGAGHPEPAQGAHGREEGGRGGAQVGQIYDSYNTSRNGNKI